MTQRETILAAIPSVAELPASAAKLAKLVQDPDVDIQEVVRILEFDPGLTTNVLRMANSAHFAGPHQIASVQQAIVRLGLTRVFHLTMASAMSTLARAPVKGYDLPAGQLYQHAVFVAICAEEIARAEGKRAPVHLFTAALLHNIGKIVLGTYVDVDAKPIVALAFDSHLSFEDAEHRVLGVDHAEAGAALLQHWSLPDDVVEVARWHHNPDKCTGDSTVVDLVHVADALAMESGVGVGTDGLNYRASEDAWRRLGLTALGAEQVVCRTLVALQELEDLFGTA